MDSTETELKLALDAGQLDRVARLPAIARHKQGRAISRPLDSTYYDTPERALQRAGLVLRLRRDGRAWIQTVKDAGSRVNGLFQRHEWEMTVPDGTPHVPHLRATGLDAFRDDTLVGRLIPILDTRVRRASHVLAGPGWEVEMAVDRGEIVAGDRRDAVAEVELELRQGTPAILFALAADIAAALPCRVMSQSKSERGFLLAAGETPKPVKATPLTLEASMSAGAAFQAVARNCLEHLGANDAALRGADPAEAIHQMRVALRRLRSAVKVFRKLLDRDALAPLRAEIRWLLSCLGPARDGDVFLAEILDPVLASHPDAPALTQLHQEWRQQRDQDFATALAAVDSPRFARLHLALGQWVAAPRWTETRHAGRNVTAFARKVLTRHHRALMRAGGRNLAKLPAEELHEVRILGKQMRYAAEFFASLYPRGRAKPWQGVLADLQESLGGLNDLAVAGPRLARTHHRGDWAWAAGLVCGWHENRRPRLLADAQASWKQLLKSEPFWE